MLNLVAPIWWGYWSHRSRKFPCSRLKNWLQGKLKFSFKFQIKSLILKFSRSMANLVFSCLLGLGVLCGVEMRTYSTSIDLVLCANTWLHCNVRWFMWGWGFELFIQISTNARMAHIRALHFPRASTSKDISTVDVTTATLKMVQLAWVSSWLRAG